MDLQGAITSMQLGPDERFCTLHGKLGIEAPTETHLIRPVDTESVMVLLDALFQHPRLLDLLVELDRLRGDSDELQHLRRLTLVPTHT